MKRGRAELLLVAGSLLFLLVLTAVAELGARTFSSVNLLGNSKELFVADAFGKSFGNTPNIEASSFGLTVSIDEHGFRVPKAGVPDDASKTTTILILSDSVGFGPAVEEPETFAGQLRARFPTQRIYNSSVIGYSTPDYRNVVDAFVPQHPEVSAVVLVYCLNDVTGGTARNIDRYLEQNQPAPPANLTETLRSFRLLSDANDYLRSRSKLYLVIRHRLLQTQTRDWHTVLTLYSDANAADVERSASDIAAIYAALAQRGIPLIVVLSPFEYQLRDPADPETQIPQRRIGDLLAKAGVPYIDPRPSFDPRLRSTDYFLAYDSMHFSAEGHRVMANVIGEALENRQ
jgi:lysophospholipase L1-like esterase